MYKRQKEVFPFSSYVKEKATEKRLFIQLLAALKSWTPDCEVLVQDETHYIGYLMVLGRKTHVWMLKPGGFSTGETKLAGFHVNFGHSHIAISPSPGEDVMSIFAHELFHCIHWNTNGYEPLSTEGAALMGEHMFRLIVSTDLTTKLANFDYEGKEVEDEY